MEYFYDTNYIGCIKFLEVFIVEKKLGVEVEFTGVKRKDVVKALEYLFHTEAVEEKSKTAEDGYMYHRIKDTNGDTWLVVRDRSIKAQVYERQFLADNLCDRFSIKDVTSQEYMVEIVSPALTSKSLPLLFTVVDIVKSLGGIVNSSCGIHVHIDKPGSVEDIYTLFKRFYVEQDNIFKFFDVQDFRLNKYCKPYVLEQGLDENLKFDTEKDFLNFLYENFAEGDNKRSIRYHALNFYSLLQHNTIEFRIFNSTLNRVEIAKILDWILHFVYTYEDYSNYVPVLGSILMNEIKEE